MASSRMRSHSCSLGRWCGCGRQPREGWSSSLQGQSAGRNGGQRDKLRRGRTYSRNEELMQARAFKDGVAKSPFTGRWSFGYLGLDLAWLGLAAANFGLRREASYTKGDCKATVRRCCGARRFPTRCPRMVLPNRRVHGTCPRADARPCHRHAALCHAPFARARDGFSSADASMSCWLSLARTASSSSRSWALRREAIQDLSGAIVRICPVKHKSRAAVREGQLRPAKVATGEQSRP